MMSNNIAPHEEESSFIETAVKILNRYNYSSDELKTNIFRSLLVFSCCMILFVLSLIVSLYNIPISKADTSLVNFIMISSGLICFIAIINIFYNMWFGYMVNYIKLNQLHYELSEATAETEECMEQVINFLKNDEVVLMILDEVRSELNRERANLPEVLSPKLIEEVSHNPQLKTKMTAFFRSFVCKNNERVCNIVKSTI